jgi:two-component system LytT family sensor kinase
VVPQKLILITLLIKLGIAAAVSSALVRSQTFKEMLFAHRRRPQQTVGLVLFLCVPLTLGVWARVIVPNFLAADIAFEAIILAGILLGTLPAMLAALLLALPAVLHGEYLTLPFNLLVAIVFGAYGLLAPEEAVWTFSPFVDLSLYDWIRRNLRRPRLDMQILLLGMIVGMQGLHLWLAQLDPRRLFAADSQHWPARIAICLCAPVVVGIPLKIWNAVRMEMRLEEQERLLLEARLDALQRQINPHFIFNTLNSIATLVRVQPDAARVLIVRLASILRVLFREHETFLPLREEMRFAEDFLTIEQTRFGEEKLRIVQEIAAESLDVLVPSMILQPLIENSIRHGLGPRLQGGQILLRSRLQGETLTLEVEDDGVGMDPDGTDFARATGRLTQGGGIGMRNVRERLHVLYGPAAAMQVTSQPGQGTRITVTLPAMTELEGAGTDNGAYREEPLSTDS